MQITGEQMLKAGITEEQIEILLKGNSNTMGDSVPVKKLEVTTTSDLSSYTDSSIVELPEFSEGQPLVAKIKRPSLLFLASKGGIPNSLLSTAGKMFTGNTSDVNNKEMLKEIYDVCYTMAQSALVEPTVEDIEKAGMSLTDEQLMFIFNYTQTGVKALEKFR